VSSRHVRAGRPWGTFICDFWCGLGLSNRPRPKTPRMRGTRNVEGLLAAINRGLGPLFRRRNPPYSDLDWGIALCPLAEKKCRRHQRGFNRGPTCRRWGRFKRVKRFSSAFGGPPRRDRLTDRPRTGEAESLQERLSGVWRIIVPADHG